MLLENIKLFLFLQPLQGNTERCLSGRKERFAKPSYGLNCTEGSNPSLSAALKEQTFVCSFFVSRKCAVMYSAILYISSICNIQKASLRGTVVFLKDKYRYHVFR